MRVVCTLLMLSACLAVCRAQSVKRDPPSLEQIRAKYDAPFSRNLQSFDCAVDFDWKLHWTDTIRVGDEGTDEEIEKFIQPIHNHVTVTRDDAVVSSGMTEEQEHTLPRGGMAEGLLEHAVRFSLRTWLVAANNALLPQPGTPVHIESSGAGYQVGLKIQNFDVAMNLSPELALQDMGVKGSSSDRQEFRFQPGTQGFHVNSWTMGEDGNFTPGHRLIFTYTYQQVGGFEIPSQVVVHRESHHEFWRYGLSNCTISTSH